MNPNSLMEARYLSPATAEGVSSPPSDVNPQHELRQLRVKLRREMIRRNVWGDHVKAAQLEIDNLQDRKLELETELCEVQYIAPTSTPRKISKEQIGEKQDGKFSPANLLRLAKQGKLADFVANELGAC